MLFYLSFLRPPPQSVSITPAGKGKSPNAIEITLTPQIANDLRIAYLEEAIDIFYSWVGVSPSSNRPGIASGSSIIDSFGFMEPQMKLTTWHRSSMYKTLHVPLPHTATRGQEWRLALFCQSPTTTAKRDESCSKNVFDSILIDLMGQNLGSLPFPVVSMPVKIEDDIPSISFKKTKARNGSSTPAKNFGGKEPGVKQNQIERFYWMSVSPITDTFDSPVNSVISVQENSANPRRLPTIICLREDTSFDLDKVNFPPR